MYLLNVDGGVEPALYSSASPEHQARQARRGFSAETPGRLAQNIKSAVDYLREPFNLL